MRKPLYYILLLLTAMHLNGCKDDFEVNADWKEIDVVYGLLSKSDSVQYIKINKAFLNEDQNALEIAKIEDSLYHQAPLEVTLETWTASGLVNTTQLQQTVVDGKEPGVFPSPEQMVYRTPPGYRVHAGDTNYVLKVKNTQTGVEASSVTKVVGDVRLVFPTRVMTFTTAENFYSPLEFQPGINGRFYDFNIKVIFREAPRNDTANSVSDTVNWNLTRDYYIASLTSRENVKYAIRGLDFFEFMKGNIPVKDNVVRKLDYFQIEFHGGGDDLYNYIQVNRPSLGIVQKRPEYTNITNGVGLFSSRNTNKYLVGVTPATVSELISSPLTAKLNFLSK